MRWLVCGGLLVGACFNPTSTGEGSSDGSSAAGSSGAGTSTGGPTTPTSTTGTTGASTSGTTAVDTTAADTAVVDTTAMDSTVGTTTGTTETTSGSDATTVASTGAMTETDMLCNGQVCLTCHVCMDGTCVLAPGGTMCVPPVGACSDRVWGLDGAVCHAAGASSGTCNQSGACQPTCEEGEVIAECTDAACILKGHNCIAMGLAEQVTTESLCETQNAMTDLCKTECVGSSIQVYTCQAAGACQAEGVAGDCGGYACDPQTVMCKDLCMFDQDCAPDYTCNLDKMCEELP